VINGPQLFLRYAFMPNRLGYCGADDHQALLEYGLEDRVDAGLVTLEQQFEGAYPYLQLIARANGLDDPFDLRVVEAYWIGNELLERVDMGALFRSLEERFRGRTKPKDWPWLASKVPAGARPHHSFHVLDVFPRVGLMRSGAADHVLETIEQCRIRWARVLRVEGAALQVQVVPLVLRNGQLELGPPQVESVTRWVTGRGFVDDVPAGGWVAVHWGWACAPLTARQRSNLERYTWLHVALCNQTL
jgi:hypothetical protein